MPPRGLSPSGARAPGCHATRSPALLGTPTRPERNEQLLLVELARPMSSQLAGLAWRATFARLVSARSSEAKSARMPMTDAARAVAAHATSVAKLELELAALELKKKLAALGVGIGLAVGAALLGLLALGFAFATLAAGLATFLATVACALARDRVPPRDGALCSLCSPADDSLPWGPSADACRAAHRRADPRRDRIRTERARSRGGRPARLAGTVGEVRSRSPAVRRDSPLRRGHDGAAATLIVKRTFARFLADDCMGLAKQVAYSSLLAFFPDGRRTPARAARPASTPTTLSSRFSHRSRRTAVITSHRPRSSSATKAAARVFASRRRSGCAVRSGPRAGAMGSSSRPSIAPTSTTRPGRSGSSV